ncbi:hypothetical protein D3C77_354950 [compost metagenome]
MPLIANDQRYPLGEGRVSTENSGERLRGRDKRIDVIEPMHFVSRRNSPAIRAARRDPQAVQLTHQRIAKLRSQRPVRHDHDRDVGRIALQVPVQQRLAKRGLAGPRWHLQGITFDVAEQSPFNSLYLGGEELPGRWFTIDEGIDQRRPKSVRPLW